jgi:iron complex outermembrane receptor protein
MIMKNFSIKILLLILGLSFHHTVYSQQITEESISDTIPVYTMSEIVVLGKRSPAVNSAKIYERSSDQVEILDVRQVDQALTTAPGLYFSRNSKNENTFLLNGFEQRQVNVFLDGVPISVAFDGVEASNHKRFFGKVGFNLNYGKVLLNGYAVLNQASSYKLSNKFKPQLNEKGPERENSDFKKISMGVKLHYQFNSYHRLGLHLNVIRNEYGVPPNASVERPRYWRFPKWDKNVISLNSEHHFGSKFLLRTVLFVDQYKNILKSYDDNTYSSQTKRYAFTSEYDDYAIGATVYQHLDLFSFGLTEGVITFKRDVHREKSYEEIEYDKYATDLLLLGVEQELIPTHWLTVSAGFDIEYLRPLYAHTHDLRGPLTLYNGQLSFYAEVSRDLNIFVATGTKSRFPTLKELYSEHLGRTVANPELKAERSLNSQTGLTWKQARNTHQISYFYNQLSNLITIVQLGDNTQQFQNIGEALLSGFNLNSEFFIENCLFHLNYTYLLAKNMSPDRSSDMLEYRPTHRLNFLWRQPVFEKLNIQTEISITRDQSYQNPDNTQWQKLNNFAVFNLKFDYLILNDFYCYLRIDNIFDENYVCEYGIPMPGRELSVGIKFGI